MKKVIFGAAVLALAAIGVLKAIENDKQLSNLTLDNIEAFGLNLDEDDDDISCGLWGDPYCWYNGPKRKCNKRGDGNMCKCGQKW